MLDTGCEDEKGQGEHGLHRELKLSHYQVVDWMKTGYLESQNQVSTWGSLTEACLHVQVPSIQITMPMQV